MFKKINQLNNKISEKRRFNNTINFKENFISSKFLI